MATERWMETDEIKRNKRGWKKVFRARWDNRLHFCQGDNGWHFLAIREGGQFHFCPPQRVAIEPLTFGPFGSQEEAEEQGRNWFILNPSRVTAEVLAASGSEVGLCRSLLQAMNDGDTVARGAFFDKVREDGFSDRFVYLLTSELQSLGIWTE